MERASVGENLLAGARGTHEHERAPVVGEEPPRGAAAEPMVETKSSHRRIDRRREEKRDRCRLDPAEPEAVVAQPVQVVARVAASEPKPDAQLRHDLARRVQVAVGLVDQIDDSTPKDLHRGGSAHAAGIIRVPVVKAF
jgi:hypothetical protein